MELLIIYLFPLGQHRLMQRSGKLLISLKTAQIPTKRLSGHLLSGTQEVRPTLKTEGCHLCWRWQSEPTEEEIKNTDCYITSKTDKPSSHNLMLSSEPDLKLFRDCSAVYKKYPWGFNDAFRGRNNTGTKTIRLD